MKVLALVMALSLLGGLIPSPVWGQEDDTPLQLAVPLLEGDTAPFSGILVGEDDFRYVIQVDAELVRYRGEASIIRTQLETERALYQEFLDEQAERIRQLSTPSWWDDNGNWFMISLGLVLGIALTAIVVGVSR